MEYDFAVSYAGQDKDIAAEITKRIKQRYQDCPIFFAPWENYNLVGQNGEDFFSELFTTSKEVIVLLSESYKNKPWTRYEWDIIQERSKENRFIPIKIDDVKILGLPSNIIYEKFNNNYEEIADLCIKKLITYEKSIGIHRESDIEKNLNFIMNSEGVLDKSCQLLFDNRKRTPLANIEVPYLKKIEYSIHSKTENKYSVLKRTEIRITFKKGLSKDIIRQNMSYCIATYFNKEKPDALALFAYCEDLPDFFGYNNGFNVARATFAPYGKWEEAEEGFAYNLPVSKFNMRIDYNENYFSE